MKRFLIISFLVIFTSWVSPVSAFWDEVYTRNYSGDQAGLSDWKDSSINGIYPYYRSEYDYYEFTGDQSCTGNRSCSFFLIYNWDGSGEPTPVDCSVNERNCSGDSFDQPVCESPNYIDVASGECVPPTELCFTTLEDMYPECVYIGEDDPDDDVPEGCVKNSAGMQMCLTDDPACYEVDGKTVCPEPDNVCGIKNGVFTCVDPVVEGCGSFNGEQVCFTPQGDKVEPESPDHPKNGGNLDGDDTNDVTDSRPPDQGGDPSDQPDSGTTTDGSASEKQQKLGNKELSEINKGIDGLSSDIKNLPGQLTETNDKTVGDYFNDVVEFGDAAILAQALTL